MQTPMQAPDVHHAIWKCSTALKDVSVEVVSGIKILVYTYLKHMPISTAFFVSGDLIYHDWITNTLCY